MWFCDIFIQGYQTGKFSYKPMLFSLRNAKFKENETKFCWGEKKSIKSALQIRKHGWVTDHCSQRAAKCMCHANHSTGQTKGEKEEQRPPHGCHNRLSSKLTQYHICKNSHWPRGTHLVLGNFTHFEASNPKHFHLLLLHFTPTI